MDAPHDLAAGRVVEVRHLSPGLVRLEARQEQVPQPLRARLSLEVLEEGRREDVLVLDEARVVGIAGRDVLSYEGFDLSLNPVRFLGEFEIHDASPASWRSAWSTPCDRIAPLSTT